MPSQFDARSSPMTSIMAVDIFTSSGTAFLLIAGPRQSESTAGSSIVSRKESHSYNDNGDRVLRRLLDADPNDDLAELALYDRDTD